MKPDFSANDLATQIGQHIYGTKGLALVGMSPGNPYFAPATVSNLLAYCAEQFSTTQVFIPEESSIHSYHALGYELPIATKKARLNSNALRNRSNKSISANKLDTVNIISWTAVIQHQAYNNAYQEILALYNKNIGFRNDAEQMTRKVLKHNKFLKRELEKATKIGVHYLLEELAFITAAPKIFNQDYVAYLYHKPWAIYQNYVAGVYDNKPKEQLGFILLQPSYAQA